MDELRTTVIRPTGPPLICDQGDGTWHMDLDDSATVVLSSAQVHRLADDIGEQMRGVREDEPVSGEEARRLRNLDW